MEQVCEITGTRFHVSKREQSYCHQNNIPLPTICPRERLRNLIAFRNRLHLWHRTCDSSGKQILSAVRPERKCCVYDVDIWESDSWDPTEHGRDVDFSRPFFEQFAELLEVAPVPNLAVIKSTMENSDYTNGITGAKNCYLVFMASYNEDCMFSYHLISSRNIVDSVYATESELCYDCLDVRNCYNLFFSEHCVSCSDSYFLSNCRSCSNCYGCVNLTQKDYCWYNEQLTEEEYKHRLAEVDLGSHQVLQREKVRFDEYAAQFPSRAFYGVKNQKVHGNYCNNSKNVSYGYFCVNSEDIENSVGINKAKSSFFHTMFGNNSELVYNSVTCGENVYNVRYCVECWNNVRDLEYCMYCCHGAHDSFGCVGLHRQGNCVLNKPYSESDYRALVAKLKEHMRETGEYGRMFPPTLSLFNYNECDVDHYLPADKETVVSLGYLWRDEEPPATIDAVAVPDNISDVGDEILKQTFRCELTGKGYRIIGQELEYYRKNHLPLPRIAPIERLKARVMFSELLDGQTVSCASCSEQVVSFQKDNSRAILCEKCFQEEVL